MNLEEQLKMATGTVTEPTQPVATAEVQTQSVADMNPWANAQMQAEAQVVQPTQTAMNIPVQPVQQVAPMPTQMSAPVTAEVSGVQTIQLGQQVNTRHINVLKKLGIGEKVRFTLLNNDAGVVKYHYTENMGKFACFSTDQHLGQCCRDLGEPKVRYYIPILVYPIMPNDPRNIIPNAHAELKVLSIWDVATYNAIAETVLNAGHNNIDFIATGTDSFGRLDVRNQPDTFKSQFATDVQAAQQTWEQYKATVPTLIRKNMDENTYNHVANQLANPTSPYNAGGYGNYQNYNGIM